GGRDFVTPDDVKAVARPALRHRLRLRHEAELEGATPDSVLESILLSVPTPRRGGRDGDRPGDVAAARTRAAGPGVAAAVAVAGRRDAGHSGAHRRGRGTGGATVRPAAEPYRGPGGAVRRHRHGAVAGGQPEFPAAAGAGPRRLGALRRGGERTIGSPDAG